MKSNSLILSKERGGITLKTATAAAEKLLKTQWLNYQNNF